MWVEVMELETSGQIEGVLMVVLMIGLTGGN